MNDIKNINSNNNLHVLIDAKKEYTSQLKKILSINMYEGFLTIYKDAKEIELKNGRTKTILKKFQELLSLIPKWSVQVLSKECERIKLKSGCDWLDLLITAVFVTHSKVLISIKNVDISYNDVQLDIPNNQIFIHKCYIEAAREIWKNPYLFYDEVSTCEYQRNIRDCEKIIMDSIGETIRQLLPVKNILKEYLGRSITFSELNDEDIKSTISKMSVNNLEELVKKEVAQIQGNVNNTHTLEQLTDELEDASTIQIKEPIDTPIVEDLTSKEINNFTQEETVKTTEPESIKQELTEQENNTPEEQNNKNIDSPSYPSTPKKTEENTNTNDNDIIKYEQEAEPETQINSETISDPAEVLNRNNITASIEIELQKTNLNTDKLNDVLKNFEESKKENTIELPKQEKESNDKVEEFMKNSIANKDRAESIVMSVQSKKKYNRYLFRE